MSENRIIQRELWAAYHPKWDFPPHLISCCADEPKNRLGEFFRKIDETVDEGFEHACKAGWQVIRVKVEAFTLAPDQIRRE